MALVSDWVTVYTAAATKLSATFGSSSGTTAWIQIDHPCAVEFRATVVTLVAATEIRITPKMRDADSNVMYAPDTDGGPLYLPIVTAYYPLPAWGPVGPNVELSAEPWLDATDNAAAVTVQVRRVPIT